MGLWKLRRTGSISLNVSFIVVWVLGKWVGIELVLEFLVFAGFSLIFKLINI